MIIDIEMIIDIGIYTHIYIYTLNPPPPQTPTPTPTHPTHKDKIRRPLLPPTHTPIDPPNQTIKHTGGLSNFFVDGEDGKPWTNTGTGAPYKFAMAKDEWYPTWAGRDSALQVWVCVCGGGGYCDIYIYVCVCLLSIYVCVWVGRAGVYVCVCVCVCVVDG
jgi:hypothetical protein